ncbi:MAG TPA: helix-turn-helix transcriptional regulator [Polyangiaceae bacterium]|nr:helix-turn-helix transcriptional regulator [Polyangiaceae bacterium]
MDAKNIASNVRRLRVEAGLTQGQLAERADMADATISRIERGRLEPSSTLVAKLAQALKVKVDDLLGSPKDAHGKPKARLRPSISKLVAVVEDLDDGAVDDVTRAVKLLIGVGRRRPATTR